MLYRSFVALIVTLLCTLTLAQTEEEPALIFTMVHDGVVTTASWSPDASTIATASEDGTLRLWDATNGQEMQQYGFESPVRGVQWNSDGARILTWTEDDQVTIIDRTTTAMSSPAPHDLIQVAGAIWLHDGRVLIWGDTDVLIYGMDGMEWGDNPLILPHESPVMRVSVNNDGTHVYTFTEAGVGAIWDADSGEQVDQVDFGSDTLGVVWTRNETKLVAWGLYGSAVLLDTANRRRSNLSHRTFVNGARFNRDETRVMTWAADDRVKVWSADNGAETLTLVHNDWVNGARWNADETRILSWAFDVVWLWDAESGALLAQMPHENHVNGASFHPQQESEILTWAWDGTARVWDVTSVMRDQTGDHNE